VNSDQPDAVVSCLTAGSFALFPHTVTGGLHPTIAVPSRLHYKPSVARPLAGLRLAVKDIIDLKGVHTTGGCRAYRELYPPRNKTAPALQRLIDLGAIVVGKTRTGQFAFGTAPMDSLDYFSNLNPRGDGHQSQSGSSGGSAGAVAAYYWIDFAIGTDSEFAGIPRECHSLFLTSMIATGSIRGPANVYGVFAMRPTHGILPTENILPQSPSALIPQTFFFWAMLTEKKVTSWTARGCYAATLARFAE
jgi:Amidase